MTGAAFVSALILSAFIAGGSATIIEKRSRSDVRVALETAGHSWARIEADGLQVIVMGTAPSEAARFRAISLAGTVVEATRVVDATDVAQARDIAPPAFSLEILRNDDGISLIGLVPAETDRAALVRDLTALAAEGKVTDMLETADYPVPDGWQQAYDFGLTTLRSLPRSKISIAAGEVAVTAITDSATEKARIETSLARRNTGGLKLTRDISAPRPVITPFTLRFLIDAEGARFDACSADTDRARTRILAAARAAGATGDLGCTVGMGVPSPDWAEAVGMALAAMKELGEGSVTFSDADIALIAGDSVSQAVFDKVVGELESNLPEVFSLKAELTRKPEAGSAAPEFSATLAASGQVQLRGRLTDERQREAVENFARARFGNARVYGATRLDDTLPLGWPVRVLAALEALDELAQGAVVVSPDMIRLSGVTGNPQASDAVARILAARLGEGVRMDLSIRYDKRLDPVLGLPTGPECVAQLNAVLRDDKLSFEPGSAVIAADEGAALDQLAEIMKTCADFRMELAGHTDSQGSEEFNERLSQERADAVRAALMERRVLVGNLTAKGYGESQPIADNGTEAGREANRRIEFVLLDETPVEGSPTAAVLDAAGGVPAPGSAAPEAAGTPPQTVDAADAGAQDETQDPPGATDTADAQAPDAAPGEPAGDPDGIVIEAVPATADTPRPRARPEGLGGTERN
ncbi:OmpA family protein [Pontitalea aquivivens]|uniref:OmpA family protein n=1 Tax=Pontitalea aquivivens TaxID=3388663 RepID=UPI003970D8BF